MMLAQSNPGMRVLVAGTGNILDNMYWGKQRSSQIMRRGFHSIE